LYEVEQFADRLVCDKCGSYTHKSCELQVIELWAALALLNQGVTGECLKFSRKALGMTKKDLAQEFSVVESQISMWESYSELSDNLLWVTFRLQKLLFEKLLHKK